MLLKTWNIMIMNVMNEELKLSTYSKERTRHAMR